MLDYRIATFLTLCETMNYRNAAKVLNITQPGVTQHIQYLENFYGCKLFEYSQRKLKKTQEGTKLESYARGIMYNEAKFKEELLKPKKVRLRIGATKTIGNYTMADKIENLIGHDNIATSVYIDNTENLLKMLDHNEIDFAAVEGIFDKSVYDYKLIKKEDFLGVCSKHHPFYNRKVDIEELFNETLLLREIGSGTRAIFEQILISKSYSLNQFKHLNCLSSFELIKASLCVHQGITFAYKSFADYYDELGTFQIRDIQVEREFNYVYLKESSAFKLIDEYLNHTSNTAL